MTANQQERTRVMRGLHSEASKRGITHESLREIAAGKFGVGSMSELNVGQVKQLYLDLTRRVWRTKHPGVRGRQRRQAAGTAGRHDGSAKVVDLATPQDIELVFNYAQALGWSRETLDNFIARQLGRHGALRTMADVNKVLWPLKRMARERGQR